VIASGAFLLIQAPSLDTPLVMALAALQIGIHPWDINLHVPLTTSDLAATE
jgi:hypothetical protein